MALCVCMCAALLRNMGGPGEEGRHESRAGASQFHTSLIHCAMSTFRLLAFENQGWTSMSRGMGRASGSLVNLPEKNTRQNDERPRGRFLPPASGVKCARRAYESAIKSFMASLQGTSRSGSSSNRGGCT